LAEITAEENNLSKDYYTTFDMYNQKLLVEKISKGVIIQMSYFIILFNMRKPRKKQNNPLQDEFDYGAAIKKNGGIFEIGMDGNCLIDPIIIQRSCKNHMTSYMAIILLLMVLMVLIFMVWHY
jgi:hypothetical protein